MSDLKTIKHKFELLRPVMDKKMCRLWAACEAHVLDLDGETIVANATGLSDTEIRLGLRELEEIRIYPPIHIPKRRIQGQRGRIRRVGGGRKLVEEKDPTILIALEQMLENEVAGDPMSEKKWVRSSSKNLSKKLREAGYQVSPPVVSRLLKKMGFSMKANTKRKINSNSPNRDEQFQYIASQRQKFSEAMLPIISVDSKKTVLIGNFSNKGKTWRKEAEEVNQNDYPSEAICRAIPYGIYDVTKNEGYVFVGTSDNTSEFAVDAISQWWEIEGNYKYSGKEQ